MLSTPKATVLGLGICLWLIQVGVQAITIASDSFTETGGLRAPGAPLAGATTEIGNLVWQSYNTNPQAFFFDSGGAGYVTTAIVSSVLVPVGVTSDTTVQVDVNLNGFTGTQTVMIGFAKVSMPKYPYSWPIYLTVNGVGNWNLYDFDTAAHSQGSGSGLNVSGWHTMKLEYDPTTKTVNAWFDSTQLVTNKVLAETLSPIVAVGFGSNVTAATMQFDNFSVQAQIIDTTPPAAVANLAVSATTCCTATLTWTAPSDPDDPAATYDLRYSTSAIDSTNFASATQVNGLSAPKAAGSAESFIVTGLTPSTTYYFALKTADTVSNWSHISNVPTGTTAPPDVNPPTTITDLAAAVQGDQSVSLTWTAPLDAESGVGSYDLRYSTSLLDDTTWAAATPVTGVPAPKAAGSGESFTVTGLAPSTTFYFAIKSSDKAIPANVSALSNVPSAATYATDVDGPSPIADLVVAATSMTSATLTWTAPADIGWAGVGSYDIRYSTDAISDEATFAAATPANGIPAPATPGTVQTLTISGLMPGATYYYAIKSADSAAPPNVSALSNVASLVQPTDTWPPSTISNLAATPGYPDKVTLTWTTPGDTGTWQTGVGSYDLRFATSPIDDTTWASATQVTGLPAPKAPGSAETFAVTGLAPDTTFYFAIKSSDKATPPNVSALSNVATATTPPPDTTPPATISDLAADGSDPLCANLTWTAPADPDDAAPASYDVRYSTLPIDETNWVAATRVFNTPVPNVAGQLEQMTVTNLQPGTAYYFAIKTSDARGNISGLSNVAGHTTGSMPSLPQVTSLTITEKAGVTTDNYPMTLSLVFKKGDVPSHVTVRANGRPLSTQTDVKVRWPDSSVKHALVSFILPQLQANQFVTLDILRGGSNANTSWMGKADLLATDFEALMSITVGEQTTNVSARQLLAGIVSLQYWLKGNIVSEFIIRDWNVNVASQLNVTYLVRVYPSINAIRVDTVVENCWINARGNITYDFTLSLGQASPQVVFAKTGLVHNQSARWRKVFWQGTTPADIQVRYNIPYIISTGLLPRYDTSLVVPEATVASVYSNWSGKAHDIMDPGIITTYFPTTGGRPDIGPYPRWTAQYICGMDNRMRDVMLNTADLSGSIPVHFRETDPNRSFYQHIISVDDRPTIWTSQPTSTFVAPADRFPNPIGDINTVWTVDKSHQPSLVYIPYLVTGDYYYLEELYFWAAYDIGDSNYQYRGGSLGIIHESASRGEAWGIRNVADAANIAPDGDIEKGYVNEKVNNSISFWISAFPMGDPAKYPLIHYWQANLENDSLMQNDADIDKTTCAYGIAPWQDDYMLWSLSHLRDLGYPTLPLINWLGKTLLDRFTAPGWNPYRASPYTLPVMYWVSPGVADFYTTWADINNGFVDKVGPSDFKNPQDTAGYDMSARAALSCITHLVNARPTLEWVNVHYHSLDLLNTDPRYAFLPPGYPVGDVNQDGLVDVSDLLALAATWGRSLGQAGFDARCDFDADNTVDVSDLLILADNWPAASG